MKLKVLAIGSKEITRWISNSLFSKGAEVISLTTFTEKFSEIKEAGYNLAVIDSSIDDLENICFRLIWFCRLRVVIATGDTRRDWKDYNTLGVDAFLSTSTETSELAADLVAILRRGRTEFPVIKVLVVEDDENIKEAVRLCFHLFWSEALVTIVSNGQSSLNYLKVNTVDIVLLDLGLSDSPGFDLLNNIRNISNLPVLVLSDTAEKDYIIKAVRQGANDFIVKPFTQIELMSRIKKHVTPSSGKKT
jgi:DNA-binding response OmpR family regulator